MPPPSRCSLEFLQHTRTSSPVGLTNPSSPTQTDKPVNTVMPNENYKSHQNMESATLCDCQTAHQVEAHRWCATSIAFFFRIGVWNLDFFSTLDLGVWCFNNGL